MSYYISRLATINLTQIVAEGQFFRMAKVYLHNQTDCVVRQKEDLSFFHQYLSGLWKYPINLSKF
jgi:hypothetical protein